ncbi:MAG: helix-turn-helix transcriptional regulator [Gammaproteobacteria bacterium]|nr:helix-turn-helix transcriptional regulator [Gammaproteobacteria bacterium]
MPNHRVRYSCVDALQDDLSQIGEFEFTQSEPGPLDLAMMSTAIGGCLVRSSSTNRPLVCTGRRSPNHWTITPITPRCADGRYRGARLDSGDLLLLDPAGEIFQCIQRGHSQNAISIPLPLAERIIQVEHHTEPREIWRHWRSKSDPKNSLELDGMLRQVLSAHVLVSGSAYSEDEFAGKVIALAQATEESVAPRPNAVSSRRIVARAQELIHSRLDSPPTITDLCEVSFASRRALFYAFKALLGRSPHAHVKMLRLHAARRRILRRRDRRCVQQVAYELGFQHPGQFAIDYARTFGESPSETRKRAGLATGH